MGQFRARVIGNEIEKNDVTCDNWRTGLSEGKPVPVGLACPIVNYGCFPKLLEFPLNDSIDSGNSPVEKAIGKSVPVACGGPLVFDDRGLRASVSGESDRKSVV